MRQIAVFVPIEQEWTHPILSGIAEYKPEEPWEIFLPPTRPDDMKLWLKEWNGNGVICALSDIASIRRLQRKGLPTVNLSGASAAFPFPSVLTDDLLVGQMAADHFLERGFDHIAFCGNPSPLGIGRRDGLRNTYLARRPNATFHLIPSMAQLHGTWTARMDRWRRLLTALPSPLAVLCNGDEDAHALTVACRMAKLAVPEQVAILGSGNITFRCELSNPPLSSIDLNVRHRGYEAAALLDRILAGHRPPPPTRPIRVPPAGLVLRQSTDTIAVADMLVASAVRYIRQNLADVTPATLASTLATGRRTLERRFLASLRQGISQVIWRERVRLASTLLTTTREPCYIIAERCGFAGVSSFATVYRAHTGRSPTAVRDAALTAP